MHLIEGKFFLNLLFIFISVGLCLIALKKSKQDFREVQVPLLGVGAVFIFLLQLITFAMPGGLRGHLCGALLLAMIMGQWSALLIATIVVLIQTLLFSQGSVLTLGINIFTLGYVSAVLGFSVLGFFKTLFPHTRQGFLTATAFASWCSLFLSMLTSKIFLAISGAAIPVGDFLIKAAALSMGEALLTTALIALLLANRPDLVIAYCCGNHKDVCYEHHHHKQTHHHHH